MSEFTAEFWLKVYVELVQGLCMGAVLGVLMGKFVIDRYFARMEKVRKEREKILEEMQNELWKCLRSTENRV